MNPHEPGQLMVVGGEQLASTIGAPRQEGGSDPSPALLGHDRAEHVGPLERHSRRNVHHPPPSGRHPVEECDAHVLGGIDMGTLQPLVDFRPTRDDRQAIGNLCLAHEVVEQVDVVAGDRLEPYVGHGPKILPARFTRRLGIRPGTLGRGRAS